MTKATRRQFLSGAAAAATVTVLKPSQVRGTAANSKILVGLIGSGNRGRLIARTFQEHEGFAVVATHDYFADRASEVGDLLHVAHNQRFDKLSGYKRLLDSKVDAVAIESPPFFHPEQAATAVDAGKHVYLAKPIAVDAPGCRRVAEAGRAATRKKQVFLVDFQTRVDPFFQEALRRVHAGALGRIAFGEATYHAKLPWARQIDVLKRSPGDPEARLAAWGLDRNLSGDIITEQNIHVLDVMNWIMQDPPECVWGACGHKVRQDPGNCHDHFVLTYRYPHGIAIAFSSRQFDGYGTQPDGIRNRMFGSDGVLETKYAGEVVIRGNRAYPGGSSPGLYREGIVANIAQFHQLISGGRYDNATVAPSVQSNLITIMGRTAAYRGDVVTWDQTRKSSERLEGHLEGLKA